MPQWKLQYSVEDRWHLVNYVREILALPRQGREPDDSSTPARFERLKMAESADADRGKLVFASRCALCHGDAGQGEGWAGGNLVPPAANFTDPDVREMSDGRWFWRLTVGVRNSAMPRWGLVLTEEERWDVINYEKSTFVFPPKTRRILPSRVPDRFVGLDNPIIEAPDYEVSYRVVAGKDLYSTYCAECHASDGRGGGPFADKLFPRPANLASGALKTAGDDYRFWKIYEGVAGTSMPPWKMILAEDEVWNVLNYEKSAFTP
jgi:mono/diheme cytochrome c family protein